MKNLKYSEITRGHGHRPVLLCLNHTKGNQETESSLEDYMGIRIYFQVYTGSASGMLMIQQSLDMAANNIANVKTSDCQAPNAW